jgi:hypothetical protein
MNFNTKKYGTIMKQIFTEKTWLLTKRGV